MEVRERKQQEQETLKEKLRVKWNTRDFTPKEDHTNILTMNVFFFMILSLSVEALIFLIPSVFPESTWIMRGVMLFMIIETVINWHRSYFDTDNYVKAELKQKHFPDTVDTPADWVACIKCQVDRPPRAFHCNHCGKCMLKRVHHCFLTGSCIGFYNQRFFVIFCLWSTITSGFCLYLQLTYLNMDLPLNTVACFTYIPPVAIVQFFTGYLSFGQTLLIFHFSLTIVAFFTALFFFLWHVFLVYEGLTLHEGFKRIYTYSGTLKQHVQLIFGSYLYIPVLIFIPYRFELVGDGVNWKVRPKRVKGQ
ncbi:Zinc finger DHHC-type containing 22 [Mactra antiquata]